MKSKIIFGFWLYLISDCIMFTCLFISFLISKHNFYLYNKIFNFRIILIETLLLLICSYITNKIYKKKEIKYCIINLLFSFIFILFEFKDFYHLNFLNLNFSFNNFFSNYFLLIMFHCFHVIISTIYCLNIIYLFYKKKIFTINNLLFSLIWHFIHIIWLLIVFFVYIKN